MLLLLSMISFMMSLFIMTLKHPLSMGVTLLIQSIMISLITGFFNLNYWYSYILFLIMIGGMLVLFIYMTSIAPNEQFYPSIKLSIITMFLIFITLISLLTLDYYFFNLNNINELMTTNFYFNLSLNKYFNSPNILVTFMIIIYLFITLLAVVKITDFKKGMLRQRF
uniref:NADH-ubiquinone oxidoreductase chain 6 n=1 Tax=Copris tripartitus TaxID=438892 RepID=A0A6C0NA85_COPTR|nr:NADH dehydrogenase subunit 6 [Copris tripartitus]QHW07557.1 NADH dehydrogenase subunit 6 [Copris tripartitus]